MIATIYHIPAYVVVRDGERTHVQSAIGLDVGELTPEAAGLLLAALRRFTCEYGLAPCREWESGSPTESAP